MCITKDDRFACSGGHDRCIRIWNTSIATTGNTAAANVATVDTGSQVCNLAWRPFP